jgi:hypothetical protein
MMARTLPTALCLLAILPLLPGGPSEAPGCHGNPSSASARPPASAGPRLTLGWSARAAGQQAPLDKDDLAGLQAREIGPAVMSGRLVDLAVVEADPRVFYVASSTGGLWKTTNNGVTFTAQFQNEAVHSIGAIAVHQVDTSLVWVGTGERANRQSTSWGDGVYRSRDGGNTWLNTGLRDSHHVGRIVLHPTDPGIVYVAAKGHLWGPNEERGLYKTADGGESWERILFVDEDTGVVDVTMDSRNPDVLYAASYQRRRTPFGFHGGGPGSALWRSEDAGGTWTRLTNAGMDNGLPTGDVGRIGISVHRADPRIVYVCIEQGLRYNASTAYEERLAGIYRSEDGGERWEHMSDWNPRPMYASQILVDPLDHQRVYMMNSFSWSDDGGRTFTVPRQTLHGDDRFVWVNPTDSRHILKADDGGLGTSWDRGWTWLYHTNLPVTQFYRVSFDYQKPYWVYGGFQDNGSWAGPSATYRSEGILNGDWVKWGGGDGFLNLVDTTDNRALYTESQYLGLERVDLPSGQRQAIRPGDPTGAISARKNWNTWEDPSAPEERLGNAMAPANWDGPFLISPHDPRTLYAGTNILWKSTDQGRSWESLGDLTRGVDRRTLPIMGRLPTADVLSLDDGIPYWPTLTAVAESPVEKGVLWVGTDDGNVQVSRDDGSTWTEVAGRMPGLPDDAWINGIEASRHVAARAYVAANNYRNDDFANYVYVSDDYGSTWRSLEGGLPPDRVARTIREDPRSPDVLYLGTELGAFYSPDRGSTWVPLDLGMPTAAVNDLVVHPRDNDLIFGTHGRGIWILDNVNALQELTPEVRASPAHLFTMEPAEQIRYRSEKGHAGDMVYRGANPPAGALADYWLGQTRDQVRLRVLDEAGREVARIPGPGRRGINRAVWNLRHTDPGQRDGEAPRGPLVVPGPYTVRLEVGETVSEQSLQVLEDPRIQVDPDVRRRWTEDLLALGSLVREVAAGAERMSALARRAAQMPSNLVGQPSTAPGAMGSNGRTPITATVQDAPHAASVRDLVRQWTELGSRARRLMGEVERWVGPPTAQQRSQWGYYREMLDTLTRETDELARRLGAG